MSVIVVSQWIGGGRGGQKSDSDLSVGCLRQASRVARKERLGREGE
jgi:hypothetical protein